MIDILFLRHLGTMKHIITLTIALLPTLALMQACDSSEDEAELAALDVEADVEVQDNKPNVEEFDLKSNMTPGAEEAGPPGKCCKAICSWNPGVWYQLPPPYDKLDGCNANTSWWCKWGGYGPGPNYSHLEDAQWRTCG